MSKVTINVPYKIIARFGPNPCGDNGKDEVRYYCPVCEERRGRPDTKGKLYVNVKTYNYHCFLCGYSGQIGRHEVVDSNKIYDEDKEQSIDTLIKDINSVLTVKNKFNLKIPLNKVSDSPAAFQYMIDRGFTEEQMEYYDMRVGTLDQEFGRIIVPNQVDHRVYTDFYSARTYIDQTPKYHNPAQEKSSTVFNLHRIDEGSPIIVVEGALTAVAAGKRAVSTLGKTMTRSQASQIASKHPSIVYINYDYGAEEYSRQACQLMKSLLPDTKIMEVLMKDERDAADLTHEEYARCLSNAILYEPLLSSMESLI